MNKFTLITAAALFLLISSAKLSAQQGVSINSTGSNPDNSAMFEVSSTTKGFLMPRMTTTERNNIVSPAAGLLIFNTTTNCFEAYVNSAWNIVSCPAACVPPMAPPVNAATNIGCDDFTANWTAVSGATSYFLDVATDAGFTSFVPGYNNINVGNVVQYVVSPVSSGTTYYYRLRATNASCTSGNSGSIMLTTASVPASPTAGTHVPSSNQIVWNWSTVSGATAYQWNTSGTYPGVGVNEVSNPTYTQTGLDCNTAYSLYVWAYNSCGNSPAATLLTQATTAIPLNGLVGWWPFTGNANDISSYSNNGTVYGATLTTDRFGTANSAYDFNGSGNYIEVPDAAQLDITGTVTMSCWIYKPAFTNRYEGIVTKEDNGAMNYKFQLNVPGHLTFYTSRGYSDNNFSTGSWHHFLAVDSVAFHRVYIDGVLVWDTPNQFNTNPLVTNNQPLAIGRLSWYDTSVPGNERMYFLGKIDEVMIYNRALTYSEILTLYQGCTP